MRDPLLMQRLPLLLGLFVLGFLATQVILPFVIPMTWAAVLVFVSWPLYQRLLRWTGNRNNLAALLMTSLMAVLIVAPLIWMLIILQSEARAIYGALNTWLSQETLVLPPLLMERAPWLAEEITSWWNQVHEQPDAVRASLSAALGEGFGTLKNIVSEISKNIAKISMTVLIMFFFYRDGRALLAYSRNTLSLLATERSERYFKAAGDMTRAVVFGIVLTALAQSLLAGVGYAVSGAPNPVFLMLLTFLIALIPFGTPIAWGSVALYLAAQGLWMPAFGLALWGALVVSTVDNIIRPLVISSTTRVSFLVVMFGVLGGLMAFGMIGLFVGPVILAVILSVWQAWLQDDPKKMVSRET